MWKAKVLNRKVLHTANSYLGRSGDSHAVKEIREAPGPAPGRPFPPEVSRYVRLMLVQPVAGLVVIQLCAARSQAGGILFRSFFQSTVQTGRLRAQSRSL